MKTMAQKKVKSISYMNLTKDTKMEIIERKEIEKRLVDDPQRAGIRITDVLETETGTLTMFCADNESSDEDKKIRGVLYNGDDLILYGMPYSENYIIDDDVVESDFEFLFDGSYKISRAIEGTLLRVYYFGGSWCVSTHRKINANRTHWGNEVSFMELFKNAIKNKSGLDWEVFANTCLDIDFQYTFLINATTKTRFVCTAGTLSCFLYTITKDNIYVELDDDDILKEWYQKEYNMDLKSAFDFVKELDAPFNYSGLLFFDPITFQSIKLVNKKYQAYYDVRNNEVSIAKCYLSNINNPTNIAILEELYKNEMDIIRPSYCDAIEELTKYTLELYKNKHVNKQDVVIPKNMIDIIYRCHGTYIQNVNSKYKKPLTLDQVRQVVYNTRPKTLNDLIKTILYQKNKKNKL